MKIITKLWIGIAVLIVLSPLGLILPAYFKAGSSWGEWDASRVQKLVGYIPEGMDKLSTLWKAPMGGYTFRGWEENNLWHLGFAYIISAIAGIAIIVIVVLLIAKALVEKDK